MGSGPNPNDRMRVDFDLPVDADKARAMRRWFRYLEKSGLLFSFMEALFECEIGDAAEAADWAERSNGELRPRDLLYKGLPGNE